MDPTHLGAGGMAMLTLSDTENNLHFILMTRGLLEPGAGGEGGHGHPAGPGTAQGVHRAGGGHMACAWLGMSGSGWVQRLCMVVGGLRCDLGCAWVRGVYLWAVWGWVVLEDTWGVGVGVQKDKAGEWVV